METVEIHSSSLRLNGTELECDEKMTDIFKAEREARNADAAVNEGEIFK